MGRYFRLTGRIEQLDGQVRAFEKSLSDIEGSTHTKPASHQVQMISNIMPGSSRAGCALG